MQVSNPADYLYGAAIRITERRLSLPATKKAFSDGGAGMAIFASSFPEIDLADEADWEDHIEFLTLGEAGLEESVEHGPDDDNIISYMSWFYDGDMD